MDGGLAMAMVIIVGFVGFLLWAKTTTGQAAMRRTFGEPDRGQKRPAAKRTGKRPASARPAASRSAASKPRTATPPKPGTAPAESRSTKTNTK